MKSDLPDVEMYHQERLRNLELRSSAVKSRNIRASALKETTPPEDNDRDFVESYVSGRDYCLK
jgi:hypothetical protein